MLQPSKSEMGRWAKVRPRVTLVVNAAALLVLAVLVTNLAVLVIGGAAAGALGVIVLLGVGVCVVALLERHIVAVVAAAQAERVRSALEELRVLPPDDDVDQVADLVRRGDSPPTLMPALDDAVYPAETFETRLARRVALEELAGLARTAPRSGDE